MDLLVIYLIDKASDIDCVLKCPGLVGGVEASLTVEVITGARERGRGIKASRRDIRLCLAVVVVVDLATFLGGL